MKTPSPLVGRTPTPLPIRLNQGFLICWQGRWCALGFEEQQTEQHLVERDGEIAHAHAGGVEHGIGDGCSRSANSQLAEALDAKGLALSSKPSSRTASSSVMAACTGTRYSASPCSTHIARSRISPNVRASRHIGARWPRSLACATARTCPPCPGRSTRRRSIRGWAADRVYSYEILPEARDQADGLPSVALIYYAELITSLS